MHACRTLHSIQKGSHKRGDRLGIPRLRMQVQKKPRSSSFLSFDTLTSCRSVGRSKLRVSCVCKVLLETSARRSGNGSADCRAEPLLTIYYICKAKDRAMNHASNCLVRNLAASLVSGKREWTVLQGRKSGLGTCSYDAFNADLNAARRCIQ